MSIKIYSEINRIKEQALTCVDPSSLNGISEDIYQLAMHLKKKLKIVSKNPSHKATADFMRKKIKDYLDLSDFISDTLEEWGSSTGVDDEVYIQMIHERIENDE